MVDRTRARRFAGAAFLAAVWGALAAVTALAQERAGHPLRIESRLPLQRIVVSGEVRQRGEVQSDYDFDDRLGDDNDFVGSRIRLEADIEATATTGAFLQIQDSRNWGGNPTTSTGNTTSRLDGLDLHQGFVRFKGAGAWELQAGRQAWGYGTQKVISPLDWSNVGRAFDGLRVRRRWEVVQVDLLASKVAESPSSDENDLEMHGLYSTWSFIEGHPFDLYVLWTRDQRRSGGEVASARVRNTDLYTSGFQYAKQGMVVGPGALEWGTELNLQGGQRGSDDLRANAWHARLGYQLADAPWKPRGVYHFDAATGDDDPGDGDEETFDQLHPLGHEYHGYLDLVGRRNIVANRVQIGVEPRDDLSVFLDWHDFRLETGRDHLYGATGGVTRSTVTGQPGISKDVGQEIDLTVKWKGSPYWFLQGGYSRLFTGGFFADTRTAASGQDDAQMVYMQSTLRF